MRDILSKNPNLSSDVNNFKKVINTSLQLLEDIDHETFFSPFSVPPSDPPTEESGLALPCEAASPPSSSHGESG